MDQKIIPFPNAAPGNMEIDIFTETNPDSVINKIAGEFKVALLRVRDSNPDWFTQDESELRKSLKEVGKPPNITDNVLRTKFWIEYQGAIMEGKSIRPKQVFAGVCTEAYFYDLLKKRPEKVAWIMVPPINYQVQLDEALEFSTSKIREVLSKDADSSTLPPNERIALRKLQFDIFKHLSSMVMGAPVQKTMNMHVHQTVNEGVEKHSMGQLDKRLKELRSLENDILARNALKQGPEPELTEEDSVNGVILDE